MARYVDHLVSLGIRLVAIDFDNTLVDVHTEGKWTESSDKLVKRVRPGLKEMMEVALKRHQLKLAIVTQSSQTDLIRKVLKKTFKGDASKIIIRGQDKTWEKIDGVPRGGKQQHIASVKQELEDKHSMKLEPKEILLIDDDSYNTGVAMCFGVKSLTFVNDESLENVYKIGQEKDGDDNDDY